MQVAPYESCVSCFRGDTTTGVAIRGEAEAAIAFLLTVGLPEDQAYATAAVVFEQEMGCDPGMVPSGIHDFPFRICAECAGKINTNMKVGEISEGLPLYDFSGSS